MILQQSKSFLRRSKSASANPLKSLCDGSLRRFVRRSAAVSSKLLIMLMRLCCGCLRCGSPHTPLRFRARLKRDASVTKQPLASSKGDPTLPPGWGGRRPSASRGDRGSKLIRLAVVDRHPAQKSCGRIKIAGHNKFPELRVRLARGQ